MNQPQKVSTTDAEKPALSVWALMLLANQDFETKFLERAIERFTQVIALDPKNYQAFIMRGRSKVDNGDYRGGAADYSAAIELEPKNAEGWQRRAYIRGVLREFDSAISDGEESLRCNPVDPAPVKDLLCRLYSNRAGGFAAERYAEAIADTTKAIEYAPGAAIFFHQSGSCYFNTQQFDKAVQDFTAAVEREPNKGDHYLHRAYCLQALGRNAEAEADFERAKKLGRM